MNSTHKGSNIHKSISEVPAKFTYICLSEQGYSENILRKAQEYIRTTFH